ncbi:TonB-dependent receptor [Sphingopyxis sp. 550A]|jgi:iron complex outermembrane receptor protein
MRYNAYILRASLLATAACAVPFSAAHAQTAAPVATPPADRVSDIDDEIVVTAQKRAQNVKDVPIAMTVIGGKRIEDNQITSFHDIERIAPSFKSLQLGDARASTMNMRGVSSVQGNPGRHSSLGVFVDGIFMARTGMASSQDFLDIERIEVLRGPQGTLFGMNTAGGLVHIITRKPSVSDVSGRAEVVVGEYDTLEARGYLSGPIVEGKLGASISMAKSTRGGLLYNSVLDRRVDDENKFSVRGKLFYTADKFDVLISGDYHKETSICCSAVFTKVTGTPTTASGFYPVTPPPGYPFSRITIQDGLSTNPNSGGGVSMEVNVDIGDHKLTSLTGWRRWTVRSVNDPDSVDWNFLNGFLIYQAHKQFSQELRLTSPAEQNLTYVAGLFFYDRRSRDYEDLHIGPDDRPPVLVEGQAAITDSIVKDRSYAVFGHMEYKLTDKLTLAAGARYTWEPQKFSFDQKSQIYIYPNFGQIYRDRTDKALTWKVDLRYAWTPELTTYASLARGFKPGGMTMTRVSSLSGLMFEEEKNLNYELGLKGVFLDRTLTVNAAAFYTTYNNFQTTAFDGTRYITANADEFITKGVELEGHWAPSRRFSLSFGASYVDAHYTDFKNGQCSGVTGPCDLSGKRLNGSAKWNVNAAASYTAPITDGLDGYLRLDYAWKSDIYVAQDLNPFTRMPAYGVLNGRIGVNSADGFSVEVFAKNLLDKNYLLYAYGLPFGSGGYVGYVGAPRLFGIRVSKSF